MGSVFEDSRIPLSKWLLAIHMLTASKNGVSARELTRALEITPKSAWFALRIRYAMECPVLAGKLQGIVEADETYVGGKAKGKRGRGAANKTPVFTLVERGGAARSQVMQRVTSKKGGQAIRENVDRYALLMTDSLPAYWKATQGFFRETVDHGAGEYVRGRAHVNTAEGFFSRLKRNIDGTHHHVSAHHLHRYLAEFDYGYLTRKIEDGERTVRTIRQAEGRRLRYRQPPQDQRA